VTTHKLPNLNKAEEKTPSHNTKSFLNPQRVPQIPSNPPRPEIPPEKTTHKLNYMTNPDPLEIKYKSILDILSLLKAHSFPDSDGTIESIKNTMKVMYEDYITSHPSQQTLVPDTASNIQPSLHKDINFRT
jgi:hypothetical protein